MNKVTDLWILFQSNRNRTKPPVNKGPFGVIGTPQAKTICVEPPGRKTMDMQCWKCQLWERAADQQQQMVVGIPSS